MRAQPSLPPINLDHLEALLTPLGLWRHTHYGEPAKEFGFSSDDQARGLIVGAWFWRLSSRLPSLAAVASPERAKRLIEVCLDYIEAAQLPDGRFHNFRSAEGTWQDEVGSEDSFGRIVWALHTYLRLFPQGNQAERVRAILERAEPHILHLHSLRAVAFTLLEADDHNRLRTLGRRLVDAYRAVREPEWRWFEPCLTYENPRLPQSILRVASQVANPEWLQIGREALEFLLEETFSETGYFLPVGNDGWYFRGGQRARFDQMPVEAGATVELCLDAWRIFEYDLFRDYAHRALDWYHGNNLLQQPLYDATSGVVYDGLTSTGMNVNRGAESVLSYLLARLKWEIYTGT